MRTWVVASAVFLAALSASEARAQSRISVEIGGAVSSYDLGGGPLVLKSLAMGSPVAGVSTTQPGAGGGGIGMFEVRPTIVLDKGLLVGVGFREGTAGLTPGSPNLVGGDIAVGYARKFGRFMPFAKAMFGFNNFDSPDGNLASPKRTDLRLDAVLGSRLYVTSHLFVAASAFGGLGDQYGGSLTVGGDVIQFVSRGAMP